MLSDQHFAFAKASECDGERGLKPLFLPPHLSFQPGALKERCGGKNKNARFAASFSLLGLTQLIGSQFTTRLVQ